VRTSFLLAKTTALLLVFSSMLPLLRATTLVRLSLTQMAQAADTVVRVRCTETASLVEGGTVWTRTHFSVTEMLKGAPRQQITVRLPGGRVGHILVVVEAVPGFRPGEEGVLFLETTSTGNYSITAWAEGTFRIRRNPQTGEEAVTQDSSALAVFEPGARRFHVEGIRALSLGELRQRLAAALAAPATGSAR
jgi:hypothetical protein